MEWILGILIAIDQLGNAFSGGSPRATISARVGYFSQKKNGSFKLYWKTLEWIIDFSFFPIQGSDHSFHAFENEKNKPFKQGSDVAKIILSVLIVVVCLIIALGLRLAVIVVPSWQSNFSRSTKL